MRRRRVIPWAQYSAAVILVAAATVIGLMLSHWVHITNLVMLYLTVVVVCGLRWGRGPAVLASLLGVLAFDFVLVPPRLTFTVADAQYLFTFAVLLLVALVVGHLTGQLRDRAGLLKEREQETAALYAFSRRMVAVQDPAQIAQLLVEHVGESFHHEVGVLLRTDDRFVVHTASPGFMLSPEEIGHAEVTFNEEHTAGWSAGGHVINCVPLRTSHGTMGLLVTRTNAEAGELQARQYRLLEAFGVQGAVALERARLAEDARRAKLLEAEDKLHDALIHSISHALRTPLSAIIGSLGALTETAGTPLPPETRLDLIETAREEAERLNWLVSNLLDMTRLEAGHLRLNVEWHDPADLVGVALTQTQSKLGQSPVKVDLREELPLIPMDLTLMVQVLDNLLHNAAKYSPQGFPIELTLCQSEQMLVVKVLDRGPGIPPTLLERVFDKFYRVERPGSPYGTGLGLAICRGIVEAHGGRIWAANRDGGGTVMTFTIPCDHPLLSEVSA